MQLLQRQADRGDQIGTAADRLGQQDVGGLFVAEGCGRLQQRAEPAAEAAAGDFFDGEVVGPAQRTVDESAGLIVGDQTNPEAPTGQPFPESEQERGLTGTEKATGHDQPGAGGLLL